MGNCFRSLAIRFRPHALLLVAMLFLPAAEGLADQQLQTLTPEDAESLFVHRVLPVFRGKCFACHGSDVDDLRGDFNMLTRQGLLKGGESDEPSIVVGDADASPLYQAINWDGLEMPPKENDRLSVEQVRHVRQWIDAGAPWPSDERMKELLQSDAERWSNTGGVTIETSGGLSAVWTNRKYDPAKLWAYQPRKKFESMQFVADEDNPVDEFIAKRLAKAGIEVAPRADATTLIRRLAFDLTGLPPTQEEITTSLNDQSSDAWPNLIEYYLSSPHYGEQWGKHWLDVVRYADSAGFANDFYRPNAWRYRDYVIRSFNEDKPYDQFVREQIAGDELDSSDPENLIAVGFLRMGPWEHTAMSVAAVTRQQYLDDITNVVGVTFLGHELRCASCHDHKFDPIPTRDYYSMQAVFAPVQFADRDVPYQADENIDGFEEGRERIERLRAAGGVKSITSLPEDKRPVAEWDIDTEQKGHSKVNNKRKGILDRALKQFDPLAFSVYSGPDRTFLSNRISIGMPDLEKRHGKAAETYILTGGSIETPSARVLPGVLSVVGQVVDGSPIPVATSGRRLALAAWLTHPDHPLTARVIANRVWQYHFGKGIAGNPNNFGGTGKLPTHPELLDFLAEYLVANDWSIKSLHRLILTSDTWQRAGAPISDKTKQVDPDNLLYSYFPPRRLSAEELRDAMLVATGELNRKPGGIPARPEINMEVAMQPRHVMGSVAPAYQPNRTPAERHRRTIYTERIRTLRNPMLEVFNQPGLDTSCERRDSSTITPQAFTLLNSQNSFNRSLAFATRLADATDDVDQQIQLAFKIAFGREPSSGEIELCRNRYEQALVTQRDHAPKKVDPPTYIIREMVEEMTGLAFYWVEDLDVYEDFVPDVQPWDVPATVRAMADVCLVLFNSNEFIYVY